MSWQRRTIDRSCWSSRQGEEVRIVVLIVLRTIEEIYIILK